MELTDNQETQKELLVINFLLLGTDKSCLSFSIATEGDGFDIFIGLWLQKVFSLNIVSN